MSAGHEELPWWQKAEQQRAERERRLRQGAERRLKRIDDGARRRHAFDNLRFVAAPATLLDSDRLSGTLSQRLGARGMIQLLLWGLMAAVGACTLVSFFTAPLMEVDLAAKALLAGALLTLSYVL